MNIKPIHTEEDYRSTLSDIERLFDSNVRPGTTEGDLLEVLILLVEKYEDENYPTQFPDPIEAIKYYMESRNLTRYDLEPYIGNRSRVSEILNRRRPLTIRMIQNLVTGLGIPAEILIQSYDLAGLKKDFPSSHYGDANYESKITKTENIAYRIQSHFPKLYPDSRIS